MRSSSGSFDAVVIGGSAGSVEVLMKVLPALPEGFPAAVLICVHSDPGTSAALAQLLGRVSRLPVLEASDKAVAASGSAYVAPGGYHLLVERDRTLSLSIDPPVLYARPSIDVLFESAAACYANRLLALILSGASADGARGGACVKHCGGTLIVQHPASSQEMTMPEAALASVVPDHILDPVAMANFVARLGEPRDWPW